MGGQNLGKGPKRSRRHQQTIKEELGLGTSQWSVAPEAPYGLAQSWSIQHLVSPYRLRYGGTKMKR